MSFLLQFYYIFSFHLCHLWSKILIMKNTSSLSLSRGNRKLAHLAEYLGYNKTQIVAFDLPAGVTCPAASLCKAWVDRLTGHLTDGSSAIFRCYAASIEARYKNVLAAHYKNADALKSCKSIQEMAQLILDNLDDKIKVVRIHASGDFYSVDYFKAWVLVAQARPEITFFAYTKFYPVFKVARPDNFGLIYSHGGVYDKMAAAANVPTCYVWVEGTPLLAPLACENGDDYDDFLKIMAGESFSLRLHGTQKAKAKK